MAGPKIKGRRVDGSEKFRPGDFALVDGVWKGKPPGLPHHAIGSFAAHEIVEHEDGTITASPSIEVTTVDDEGETIVWSGTLERGVWSKF